MNSRLVEMIARGRLPFRGGQWIDTYNQATDSDCAGTIIAGINAKNHYYVMEEMKVSILDLSLKWEWYDMIERGEKTEEYRDLCPYYANRLLYGCSLGVKEYWETIFANVHTKTWFKPEMLLRDYGSRYYDVVRFHRGQGSPVTMLWEYEGLEIGKGKPEWGAPEDKDVFIIKLGKRIDKKEPIVLGWTRDEKGNVVDRHPVEVANAVTSAKRDNTQNYVLQPINTTDDGCASTLTGAHFYSGHITNPKGGHKENGVLDGVRIRKLTERECFRLMGVNDADIDTIQAAGISRSQQYKLAGNSIVVNCIAAIFRQMLQGNFNKNQQTELF